VVTGPGRDGQPGARRVDDLKTVSGIMHCHPPRLPLAGAPGRPPMPSTTICNRFNRWSRRGFWLGMLAALAQANCIAESALIVSPYIKAYGSAQGGKGSQSTGDRRLARWPTTKIQVVADVLGRPAVVHLTPVQDE